LKDRALDKDLLAERREFNIERLLAKMEIEKLSNRLQNNLQVFDDVIRSGRELNVEGDLLLLNRVNSGAIIYVSGNFIATKLVEGLYGVWENFYWINSFKAFFQKFLKGFGYFNKGLVWKALGIN